MMNFQFWLVLKIVKGTIQYKITNIVTDSHMESSGCLHTLWEGSLLLLDPLPLPMLLPQGGHRETVTITHRHISLFLFRKTQNHNPLTLRKSTLTWLLPPGNRLYRLFLSHSCWALSFQLTIQRQLACSLSLYLYIYSSFWKWNSSVPNKVDTNSYKQVVHEMLFMAFTFRISYVQI